MKTIGNIIWFILVGLISSIYWAITGLLLFITIIGIPLGKQCFKIASLTLWPFGKTINTDYTTHPIANILWLIIFGWELAVGYVVAGLILCVTIIGIPFGKQCFKLAQLSFFPFGAKIN
jgi:uncharacterized membrane protein YccF (DUF307 family)